MQKRVPSLGHRKALVERIALVTPGMRLSQVEELLGKPAESSSTEWLYYLNDHSGHIVTFGDSGQVDSATSWKG